MYFLDNIKLKFKFVLVTDCCKNKKRQQQSIVGQSSNKSGKVDYNWIFPMDLSKALPQSISYWQVVVEIKCGILHSNWISTNHHPQCDIRISPNDDSLKIIMRLGALFHSYCAFTGGRVRVGNRMHNFVLILPSWKIHSMNWLLWILIPCWLYYELTAEEKPLVFWKNCTEPKTPAVSQACQFHVITA